jgi:hypothetical protein
MANRYSWQEKYEAAILETDRDQMMARRIAAQKAIDARLREIQADHGGTIEERQSLMDAMLGLRALGGEGS